MSTSPGQEPTPTTTEPSGSPGETTGPPPWGDDFNPERAWHTIQTLREAEKERDQLRRQTITPEQRQQLDEYQRLIEASKSEQERQEETILRVNRERDEAVADSLRLRVALAHGISDPGDLELLGTGSEEQLAARAKRLSELNARANPQQPTPPPQRPAEQFRPGATPSGQLSDDEAFYQSIYGTK